MKRLIPALVLACLVVASPAPAQASSGALERLGSLFTRQASQVGFLPVEEAFAVEARALDGRTVLVRWTATDGYYLYRNNFGFETVGGDARIISVAIPPGKAHTDEFFGETEVYYGTVEIRLTLERGQPEPHDLALDLAYQGCADAGLCYPPDVRRVAVRLPSADTVSAMAPALASTFVSEQDRLANMLAGGRLWVIVLTFYLLGVLLTFTPCVLPMVPILSGILIGQGGTLSAKRGFLLSLVYVLAMSATYTAAGIAAALLGHNLQALFQHPAIIIAFALVFVALALAMFGFWRFELPSSLQGRLADSSNRLRGGSWVGVAGMGVLSALIVGPCVAAPLAGALLYIARTGDAVLGGSALFALSLGMGTLLLVVGATAGKWVPKAGPWMDTVKAAFGVLLLGVAIWLLERILPAATILTLWATLAIVTAMHLGALEPLSGGASAWSRLWKGLGLGLLVWGVLLLVGAASGGKDPLQPLRGSGLLGTSSMDEQVAALPFRRIKSVDDLARELEKAAQDGTPVMLDFYADWCVSCKEMERYTFPDAGVRRALAEVVMLKADVTRNDADDRELMRHLDILGPPSILFFGADGAERRAFRVVGFVPPDEFAQLLTLAFAP